MYEKLFNVELKLKQAIYRTKRIKIPKPEFYVLYNGKEAFPDRNLAEFLQTSTSEVINMLTAEFKREES